MRFFPKTIISIFFTLICVAASAQSDHGIDPTADIIVGAEDAAHELIIYFNPNCGKCRRTHLAAYETIRRDYVDTGKLRLIYRDPSGFLPSQSQTPQFQVRDQLVAILSKNLMCHYLHHGSDRALEMIDRQFRFLNAEHPRGLPPMEREDANTVMSRLEQDGILVMNEYNACNQQDVTRGIHQRMMQYRAALNEATGRKHGFSVPAYFLNGELVATDSETELPLILETLAREIGE